MLVNKLSEGIGAKLVHANEIWIATAMISNEGFQFLNDKISLSTKCTFLIGIDLPTSVSVLQQMLVKLNTQNYSVRIGKPDEGIFHPKVYILRCKDTLVAYLGSANLTSGGLNNNTELNIEINDQEVCLQLLEWFQSHYNIGYPLTFANLERYREMMSNTQISTKPLLDLQKDEFDTIFGSLNFNDRYFTKEHHLAFKKDNWRNISKAATLERTSTRNRFIELHETIYPRFAEFGLSELYPNKEPHIVSMHYHHDASYKNIDAMWLSYGKSQQEIIKYRNSLPHVNWKTEEQDLMSFINHARLQIRIELKEIGIWLLFGKNNRGSLYDRGYFRDRMRNTNYRESFFNMLKTLPSEFWIHINNETRFISDFTNAQALYVFCRGDNEMTYFIIGRDYNISDIEMSKDNLPQTTLKEFKRLLPIYQMMKHRL